MGVEKSSWTWYMELGDQLVGADDMAFRALDGVVRDGQRSCPPEIRRDVTMPTKLIFFSQQFFHLKQPLVMSVDHLTGKIPIWIFQPLECSNQSGSAIHAW